MSSTPILEPFTGADCTGTDEQQNRTLTLTQTPITATLTIIINGTYLIQTNDYTISAKVITFLNYIWDEMIIQVQYNYSTSESSGGIGIFKDVQQIIEEGGEILRFKYYTTSGANAGYDDDVTFTQSGMSMLISGLVQPVNATRGSADAILIEQGKVLQGDTKFFVNGSTNTSGTFKIGRAGVVPVKEYSTIAEGINTWTLNGSPVYKKIYARILPNGSLAQEM